MPRIQKIATATAVVEGLTDQIFLDHVVSKIGFKTQIEIAGDKHTLLKRLPAYSKAADYAPFVVLLDLDQDHPCVPDFLSQQPHIGKFLCLRVAVRALESWLMADRAHFASYFGVKLAHVPVDPDTIPNPKQELLRLVLKSRKKHIQRDVLPDAGSMSRVGPGYTSIIQEFVSNHWDLQSATGVSASLARSVAALQHFRALLLKHFRA